MTPSAGSVGNEISGMSWDKTGRRLAVSFVDCNAVAVFATELHPHLRITPWCVLGPSGCFSLVCTVCLLLRAAPHECVFHALRCVPFRSVTIRLTYGTTRQPCGAVRQPHVSRAARCGSIRFVAFLMRRSASQRVWKELTLFMGFYSYIF